MNKYPKINTLYTRNPKTFKVTDEIRCPEFSNIRNWLVTEKIDGTNIRVLYEKYHQQEYKIEFRGKTDKAQIPAFLLEKLEKMFPHMKMLDVFKEATQACLYGEGYGARIQKGGGDYRKGVSFRLVDVWVDSWWLRWDSVCDIAKALDIRTAPSYGMVGLDAAIKLVKPDPNVLPDYRNEPALSMVSLQENPDLKYNVYVEGIVARAHPMVLFRKSNPVVWKLKVKDFAKT